MLSPIPNWIVAKKHFSGGIRLPKLTRWYAAENRQATFAKGWPIFPRKTESGAGDLLSNGDLRYWNGVASTESHSVCRNCREAVYFAKDRKEHMKAGCGSLLTNAMKLLRRDKVCVICDAVSTKTCWGIPLCSKDCENEWAWTTACPDALRHALDLVEREAK